MAMSFILHGLTAMLYLLKVLLLFSLRGVITSGTCFEALSNTLLLLLALNNLDVAFCIGLEHAGPEHIMEELVVIA